MLNQLRIQRDIAVLESFTMTSIQEMAYKLIPNIVDEFKGIISSFSTTKPAIQLTSKQKDFLKEIAKHPYFDLTPLYVYVPEGLQTSYKTYCEALRDALKYAEAIPVELSNYQTFISRLLSNDDDLKSTDYVEFKYKTLNKELDASINFTSKCFKKNNHDTEVKYGQIIQNHSEWQVVFQEINLLATEIEKINRTELLKQVENITELLEMLKNKIKRKEINNISPEMLAKIADYTYIVARYMEYYSVTYFRIKALVECLNQTVDKVYGICTRK